MVQKGIVGNMNEERVISEFISINEKQTNPRIGKYSSKKDSFYKDIKNWQEGKKIEQYDIKPLQYTFEITNKCNCNCRKWCN